MEASAVEKPLLLVLTSTFPRSEDDTSPRFVLDLASRLTTKFRVTVLAPHGPGLAAREAFGSVRVLRFRYLPERMERLAYSGGMPDRLRANPLYYLAVPFFVGAQVLAIARVIRQHRPSVIHAHWWIPQGLSVVIARWLARARIPVVCTLHGGDVYSFQGGMMRKLSQAVLKRCAFVCPVSTAVRDDLPSSIKDKASTVIAPMGVDTKTTFIPDPQDRIDPNAIVFVGRLAKKKGVDWLLEAFALALERESSLRLSIVGDGPLAADLRDVAARLQISQEVTFHGALPHRELPSVYRTAGAAVMPSVRADGGDREGLGLTVVEALSCGCPVLVSDSPSFADIVIDGKNGLVVKERDVKSLADAMCRLSRDQDLQSKLRSNARSSVERYDWGSVTDAYSEIFQSAQDSLAGDRHNTR